MKISADHLEYLKNNVPMDVVFAELGYDGIRIGMNLCPFHHDTRPSLSVQPEYYNCFSSACDARGDAFRLIMNVKKCSFLEAVDFMEKLC